MSTIINYNRNSIALYYTNKSLSEINLKNPLNIEAKGSGEGKNYKHIEQEAQLYLIRNAMLKRPKNRLNKIVGIRQEINYDKDKRGLEIKISLKGIAVFE